MSAALGARTQAAFPSDSLDAASYGYLGTVVSLLVKDG